MRREHGYAWVVGVLGWFVLLTALLLHPPTDLLAIAAFAAYGVLAEIWPANLRAGTVSIETAFLIPAAVLTGPSGAAVTFAVSVFVASMVNRRPLRVGIFNAGQYAAAVLAADYLSRWLVGPLANGTVLHAGTLALFYLLFLVINHLFVDSYFLLARFDWRAAVLDGLWLDLVTSAVALPLGMGVVVAFREYMWVGVFAIATPLVILGYVLHLQTGLQQRNRNLELLYAFYQEFAEAQDVEAILVALRDRLAQVFQSALKYAGVADGRHSLLQALPGSSFAPSPAVAGQALGTAREITLGPGQAAQLLAPEANGGILLPIVTSRGLCGLVAFAWPYELVAGPQDVHLFRAAQQLATIACEKETLLRETERLAATDVRLPGLYNYRYLIARLEEGLQRNRREGSRLALVYLDLDGFKQYNDLLGHLAGDEVLREFANILAGHTRQGDVAARYAGDEFVLLLRDADRDLAEEIATRLLAEVREHRFLTAFELAADQFGLGFSYGIACDEGGTNEWRGLIDAADQAMYLDKRRRKAAR
jgi:diguanylate cyclase (GGDEF)-like protein